MGCEVVVAVCVTLVKFLPISEPNVNDDDGYLHSTTARGGDAVSCRMQQVQQQQQRRPVQQRQRRHHRHRHAETAN